jgi:hypothetical protein
MMLCCALNESIYTSTRDYFVPSAGPSLSSLAQKDRFDGADALSSSHLDAWDVFLGSCFPAYSQTVNVKLEIGKFNF